MSSMDRATLRERCAQAEQIVNDLCHGRRRWTMSVPARPDSDPDLIIGDVLHQVPALLDALAAAEERAAALEAALAGLVTDTSDFVATYHNNRHTQYGPGDWTACNLGLCGMVQRAIVRADTALWPMQHDPGDAAPATQEE